MGEILIIQVTVNELRTIIRQELQSCIAELEMNPLSPKPIAPESMNIKQVSHYTGLCESTLYSMVCKRIIPNYKPGRNLLFKKDEIDLWLQSRKRKVRKDFVNE